MLVFEVLLIIDYRTIEHSYWLLIIEHLLIIDHDYYRRRADFRPILIIVNCEVCQT